MQVTPRGLSDAKQVQARSNPNREPSVDMSFMVLSFSIRTRN